MLQYYSPCVKKRCRIFEQNDEQCEFGAKKKMLEWKEIQNCPHLEEIGSLTNYIKIYFKFKKSSIT